MNVQVETSQNKATKSMWRVDTKSMVGAVILGIAFILVEMLTSRIDAMLWNPLIIIDGITWATFTGLMALVFRQPGGIIMSEIQALSAIATGNPLGLFFIPANGAGSLVYTLFAWKLSMEKWSHHFVAQLFTNFIGNAFVALGLIYILKLPVSVAIISSIITATAGTIGATILTKVLYDSLRRSGLV